VFDQDMREVHGGLAACLAEIAACLVGCLEEVQRRGELPTATDPRHMANILVDCWEGAALRSRLRQVSGPLRTMLDFYSGQRTRPNGILHPERAGHRSPPSAP
jgi:TetR/AcrR family transcriptional repressor of nem operon